MKRSEWKALVTMIEALCLAIAALAWAASMCLPENHYTKPLWTAGSVAIAVGILTMLINH